MKRLITQTKLLSALILLSVCMSCEEDMGLPPGNIPESAPTATNIGEDEILEPGDEIVFTGNFVDAQGLTSITIVNAEMSLDENITLNNELIYELEHPFTIPANTVPGEYPAVITATNNVGISQAYTRNISIPEPPPACLEDHTVFDGENIEGMASNGAYADDPFAVTLGASVTGDMITLTGDYTNYQGNTLTVQAVPDGDDTTNGTLVWTEELLGSDGYAIYHAIPTPGTTSTYNACTGALTIYYDYEWNYEAGAGWEYWYSAELTLQIVPCTDTYTVFDAGTLSGTASQAAYADDPFALSMTSVLSGDMITLTGEYTNYQGNTLTVQAVPNGEDNTIGELSWSEELLGSDGYAIYHSIPTPGTTSTYDACSGEMTIYYDYEWNYEAGAGWEYWYSAELTIALE
ncbi:MAG: hypothetical protein JXR07_01340 [Reichenbachiella sp.]